MEYILQCVSGKYGHTLTLYNDKNVHSMQPDEDLNRSKPVVAIGLSRVVSLLLVLI